jgi:hypothetical protein
MEGLTTDRHTWATREVQSFDFPFDIITFRGEDGYTSVTAFFALPVGWFSGAVRSDVLPVNVGFALHDSTWVAAAQVTETLHYGATTDSTKAAFEELTVTVPPDSYRVSLHGELVGSDMLGGYQVERTIPDYDRPKALMSDVVLAYDVRPKPGYVPSDRRSLHFTANPFHRFSIEQPIHLYFEVYHLALDEDDMSHYEVTYRIEAESRRGILGLLRRDKPALSVSADFEDSTPSPIVFNQIDVSELDSGFYTLVVVVDDILSGSTMERRIPIELTAPDS